MRIGSVIKRETLGSKNIRFLDRKIELKSISIRCGVFGYNDGMSP